MQNTNKTAAVLFAIWSYQTCSWRINLECVISRVTDVSVRCYRVWSCCEALTCEHTSLNQLQREIKESINFAFTRSCTEGIVSYSFWAPQVRAAPTLKKTATWTTFPPRRAVGKVPGRGHSSPTVVAAAAESVLWRRATMATPNFAWRRGRKHPAPFYQRTPWCNLMRLNPVYSTNSSPRRAQFMPPCSWWQLKSMGRYLRGLARQRRRPSFTLPKRLSGLLSSSQTLQKPTWQ